MRNLMFMQLIQVQKSQKPAKPEGLEDDFGTLPSNSLASRISESSAQRSSIDNVDRALTESTSDEVLQLKAALDEVRRENEKEIAGYVERIDGFLAKIKYLSQTAAESAKQAADAAPAQNTEKILAEKDEQIALLMKEGQALAVTDQKARTAVKKMRTKIQEQEKTIESLGSDLQKSQAELDTLQRTVKSNAALEKALDDAQTTISRLKANISKLEYEAEGSKSTITSLRTEMQKLAETNEASAKNTASQTTEAQQRQIKALEDCVASLKTENAAASERHRKQLSEFKDQMKQAAEKSKAVETQLQSEVHALEAKLEAVRVYAEEASSTSNVESDAKLLRQIETLQSHYDIAKNNWQGIESSMLARLGNLERERDEAVERESEMRKKARESARRLKLQEEEITELKIKASVTIPAQEATEAESVYKLKAENEALKAQAEKAETARKLLQQEMEQREAEWQSQSETFKWPHNEEMSPLSGHPTNPLLSPERPSSPRSSFAVRQHSTDIHSSSKLRKSLSSTSVHPFDQERTFSRWTGSLRAPTSSVSTRSNSGFFPPIESPIENPMSPLASIGECPESIDGDRPGSSRRTGNDMVSVSTVAAGPSIQLVDRLSATVRRLEAEKVAAREEMSRVASQRDEARAEIVALMKATEDTRNNTVRIAELEAQVADVTTRYQTTLEMLGEKSELVEELRADVEDVKAMYRELVESTVGR
ncbi:hypothetical protein TD95_005205 [Thielaviopsis punctulata]|uniref:TATA element modulatory factor 1 TATA binding domain-containing protein n=1 Tax=Thielaviopsis punctulata TaxID=72032 RepID=A0A0F4ZHG0_9PEZI|nr:hypothetical protein TD95_005205 [Thielaviopsis punctulata]